MISHTQKWVFESCKLLIYFKQKVVIFKVKHNDGSIFSGHTPERSCLGGDGTIQYRKEAWRQFQSYQGEGTVWPMLLYRLMLSGERIRWWVVEHVEFIILQWFSCTVDECKLGTVTYCKHKSGIHGGRFAIHKLKCE